ncbi:hypothetical protein SETIT_6G157700v2 [Setaria italica]|uniref:Uncharacterized protein n=1 Tax=Setaria italica TaxID=4555 RepID=A0A368RM15_SETIT|nr:hypothetical protein SETIT_6G157700v2 [Setaria italica]
MPPPRRPCTLLVQFPRRRRVPAPPPRPRRRRQHGGSVAFALTFWPPVPLEASSVRFGSYMGHQQLVALVPTVADDVTENLMHLVSVMVL